MAAYLADAERIGWKAYQSIYPKSLQHAAETSWSRLLKNAEFAAELEAAEASLAEQVIEKVAETTGITQAMVVDELRKIGFSNMLDYMTVGPDGKPYTDFSKLTRDQAAAIHELVVESRPDPLAAPAGDLEEELEPQGHGGALKRQRAVDEDGRPLPEILKVRFKLADKRAALVDIGKHLGMFKTQHEHDISDPLKELFGQICGTALRPREGGGGG